MHIILDNFGEEGGGVLRGGRLGDEIEQHMLVVGAFSIVLIRGTISAYKTKAKPSPKKSP